MKYSVCILFFLFSFFSCSGQQEAKQEPVFGEKAPSLKIKRFDKDLHQYITDPSVDKQRRLAEIYKDFLPAFGRITINNSDSYKPEFFARLRAYFSHEMLATIYNDALNTFEDVSGYEAELGAADELIAFHFNGRKLPALYMHVSGFKENVMVLDGIISLSTDRYLGADYPAYNQFFEEYQFFQMQPQFVVRDYIKAWLLTENTFAEKKKTLLSEMVREGKVLYALSQVLPAWTKENLIGYTPAQLQWNEEHEPRIWKYMVEQNHLYEQNNLTINKYINDAPYTLTLSPDSPGRVGAWMGWQIVSAYMEKNQVPMIELFRTDSQKILKESGYNP